MLLAAAGALTGLHRGRRLHGTPTDAANAVRDTALPLAEIG